MALASRFATAKFLGTAQPRAAFAGGKVTPGAGLLAQALGPQSVAAPTAPSLSNPSPTAPSVLPPDANYDATVAGANKQHDITAADIKRAHDQALLQYGYIQTSGDPTHIQFDPSNPFSQAAMLKRNYDQAQTGNTNSYAARGQLYSGALQNAQNESGFQYQKGSDTISKALIDFLANNQSAGATNDTNLQTTLGQAFGSRVQNAGANPLYEPSAAAAPAQAAPLQDTNAAPAAFQTIPWKDSAGRPGVLHIYPDGRRVFVRG
jgi:hypothetical protein